MIYLLVANALSMLIAKETDARRIKGVYIEETGDQYTHRKFIDNTSVVV